MTPLCLFRPISIEEALVDVGGMMGRGLEADDARLAQLLALIANVNRDPKRRRTPWTPDDSLPRRVPRPPAQVETLRPRIDAAMAAFGGIPAPPGRLRQGTRGRVEQALARRDGRYPMAAAVVERPRAGRCGYAMTMEWYFDDGSPANGVVITDADPGADTCSKCRAQG